MKYLDQIKPLNYHCYLSLSLSLVSQMLDQIPKSESLKCTMERSRIYWDETIAPALRHGKTVLVVGHENNLRSLIMRLDNISKDDIINLSLPRAVPLAYRLDKDLKPIPRKDGSKDEATGFLSGTWLGGDQAVKEILDRDHKQVYDITIQKNLETDDPTRDNWKLWMAAAVGKPSPEQGAQSNAGHCLAGHEFNNKETPPNSPEQQQQGSQSQVGHCWPGFEFHNNETPPTPPPSP